MLRPHLLLLLGVIAACLHSAQCITEKDPEYANIKKMSELRARWNRRHPLTFPPLSEETIKYLDSYAKETHTDHIKSIPEINGDMANMLIEGDIIPSDQDIAELEERLRLDDLRISGKIDDDRVKRAAPNTNVKLWNKTVPIPFKIDSRFSPEDSKIIRRAIDIISENTCIRFEEDGPGKKLEYFMDDSSSECMSQVGDKRDESENAGNQKIYLGLDCLNSIGTIQHETFHALGFEHTQTRTDRDEYVQIIKENINIGFLLNNFVKLDFASSSTNYGIPYEYNSVMHYKKLVWDGRLVRNTSVPVILPKDRAYDKTVGGDLPIFNDWKMINMHYKCNESCTTQIICHNGGYQNSRKCEECVCPQFFNGTTCEIERDVLTLKIGAEESVNFRASDDSEFEDFKLISTIPRIVKAPEGAHIIVTIHNIHDRGFTCPDVCAHSALEFVEGDLTRVGKRYCCADQLKDEKLKTFRTTSNVLGFLIFAGAGDDFGANFTLSVEEPPPAMITEMPNNPAGVHENPANKPENTTGNPDTAPSKGLHIS